MAKENVTIEMTLEYDPAENNDKPAHIFIFQLLNSLNHETPIKSITYKGKTKTFATPDLVKDVALRKVDSVSDTDLPKPPAWLKDRTVLPPRIKKK